MKPAFSIVSCVLTLAVSTACSSGGGTRVAGETSPSAAPRVTQTALVPHVSNWDRFFKIDWRVVQNGPAPVVQGRVYNDLQSGGQERP
jgi:hypothetical protein